MRLPYSEFRVDQNGMPTILRDWQIVCVTPGVDDYQNCPDLCKEPETYSMWSLNNPVEVRYYMTDGTFKRSFCDAYETVRQARVEAIRIQISRQFDPCEVKIDGRGIFRGYGSTFDPFSEHEHSEKVTVLILIDDIPAEIRNAWLTAEIWGGDVSHSWLILAEVPPNAVMWGKL